MNKGLSFQPIGRADATTLWQAAQSYTGSGNPVCRFRLKLIFADSF